MPGRHVEVTLQQFYPGVLPRIRCPICLVPMHASRWEACAPTDTKSTLTSKYAELCGQTCAVTPPCCHKTGYTHLTVFDPDRKPSSPVMLLPSQLEIFKTLCKEFCRHKQEPRTVLNYAFGTFGEEKASILLNELMLPRIQDPERRATLLLSLMYFRPNTKTNCCGHNFCFNCKRRDHHESCAEEFNDNNDLVRCRTCRVLLLKVEGCDAVQCVCGFNMNWAREITLRRDRKKGKLPVDIFDILLTNDWLIFQSRLAVVVKKLWLHKHVVAMRPLVRPLFVVYLWRFRLRKVLTTELSAGCVARRATHVDYTIAKVRGVLRPAVASCVWRRRFSRAVAGVESEIFWKAYRRWHPKDAESQAEEINTLLNIGTYDDGE
ncbi:urease accessory protein, putative [Phytophthora infestans T30-4]|uniref:Urease accessory protein, putative n=2 Tax=Phytophthora infestans TaxID=4787 RepID=D0N974_PHYIT|nr:urease accessory protein, putative [Phytophthora infestans T30-4]EEY54362.1 urease accessory protein, putative [Phytophthora infestans T30-4]KAF4150152.1 hypothetical protein GN958_ATG00778 [Phytophthora infestans]KAI9983063.1 hypothetical protein PInf_006985 [Phytophthora infestans]|eukprot:XP_002904184.1 urease accessory protein, putative [Phytophthora infestans T30-4]